MKRQWWSQSWVFYVSNLFQLQRRPWVSGLTTCKVLTWHKFFFFFFKVVEIKRASNGWPFIISQSPQNKRDPGRGGSWPPAEPPGLSFCSCPHSSPSSLFHSLPDALGIWFLSLETVQKISAVRPDTKRPGACLCMFPGARHSPGLAAALLEKKKKKCKPFIKFHERGKGIPMRSFSFAPLGLKAEMRINTEFYFFPTLKRWTCALDSWIFSLIGETNTSIAAAVYFAYIGFMRQAVHAVTHDPRNPPTTGLSSTCRGVNGGLQERGDPSRVTWSVNDQFPTLKGKTTKWAKYKINFLW